MDSGKDEASGAGGESAGYQPEAPNPSSDLNEPFSGRRQRNRPRKLAATPPDSSSCRADAGSSVRVLRARGPAAGTTGAAKNVLCWKKPGSLDSKRVTPARIISNKTPVIQNAVKKSTAKKASKPTLGPKLSKSRKGKWRPSSTACKPGAEMDTSCGEEAGVVKGSSDNVADLDMTDDKDPFFSEDPDDLTCNPKTKTEKSRPCTTLQPKEVKEEESEEDDEEENEGIKEEELAEAAVQCEDGVGDNAEPPCRKKGRQPKDQAPRQPKRRKKPPVQYVRCDIEGCGTVLAHPRYLQHHIKYQHLLKKKYVCDHPSCGRLFRLQKQLLRHAKHHTDQRDYICEFCARAFKSSHNLAVHRMIHTGEKPIQCEICGFTCRQKASLNWHMKKHDAESSYQFPCSICGKKFEKKDSVIAHKAKSHPEVLIAEALAANGGSVISSPTALPETVPVLRQPAQPPVCQENQEAEGGSLTPLQQVVLPLSSQTPIDAPQGLFFQLPTHHVVQVAHQQQAPPTLLHLSAASPTHLSTVGHPQLIQLPALPASAGSLTTTVDSQSTLLTLSSVTPVSSTATLASEQAVQWSREAGEVEQIPGEGELWDRVIVGGDRQNVGEIMWEGNGEVKKNVEEIVWEREGERQILLQCAETHGDGLI